MKVIQLLQFRMNDQHFYFTNAGADFTYQNTVYLSGAWQGIDSFEQRNAPAINEHSITLSDPDLALTVNSYAGKWQWQTLSIRWLVYDDRDQLIDNFLVMQGAITMPDADESTNRRELILRVQENHTLELVHGHRTNSASQHLIDPDDNGFDLLPFLDGVKLPWGKEGNGVVHIPNSSGSGGEDDKSPGHKRHPRHGEPVEEP